MCDGQPPAGQVEVEEQVPWQPGPATQAQHQPPAGAPPGGTTAGAPPTDPPLPPPQYGPPPPPGYGPYYPPPPPRQPDKNAQIIMLAIILPCAAVFLIGIIASIAIPLLLSARNNAVNEKARNCLRTVVSAEAAYYDKEQRYGSLEELVQGSYLDESFTAGDLGQGITASITLSEDGKGYAAEVNAPTASYRADETGVIQDAE